MNCFVIENLALDIDVRDIIWGLQFVVVLLICIFPSIGTGLPKLVMGAVATPN